MVATKYKKSGVSDVKTNKQKVLLPTLKEQQRYAIYRLITSEASKPVLSKNFLEVHNNVLLQCSNMLGIFDGGNAGLMSVKYSPEKLSGIIRVNNKYLEKLKVCFGLVKSIDSQKVTVDCVYVSGMVNKAVDEMNK